MNWFDRAFAWLRALWPTGAKSSARPSTTAEELAAWTYKAPGPAAGQRLLSSPVGPRFQSTAGDQVDARTTDASTIARVRLRTAYTPSQPVVDRRLFAGRKKTLTALIRSIEDQRLHSVVHGERGIGKTSLMHVLAEAAREARYQVVYVSCGAGSSFDETFRAIAEGIPLMFHAAYGPTSPEAEKGVTMASLLPAEPITVRFAADLLGKVSGTRVLVILDEFDQARAPGFRRSIAELLKNLSDRSVRVQIVIAGVASDVTELVEHVGSIQRNVLALQLPKMTDEEVVELVRVGETASGLTFDDAAVALVTARALGIPYLASLLSHRAGLVAVEDGRSRVTAADVSQATTMAAEELRGRISRRSQIQIDELRAEGWMEAIGAMAGAAQAAPGGRFTATDAARLLGGAEAAEPLEAALTKLSASGALIAAHDDEFGRSYQFVEDSVPPHLWLISRTTPTGIGAAAPAVTGLAATHA